MPSSTRTPGTALPPFRGHRGFAWAWDRLVRLEDAREREMRRFVAGGASGRVLEIGYGVGTNWDYLPDGVDYTGIEPDPYMRGRAERNLAGSRLSLLSARAEALPFAEDSFDTVFTTLTLCSVQRPRRALAEVRRVLHPGAQFRFFEHVRPPGRIRGRIFDAFTPGWKRIGGGCHPNRRTVQAISAAGFEIVERHDFSRGPIPMVAGVAMLR
jgi:ubiquinone/menaquinone biosynthesis C-methylase UbiE